MIEVRYSGLAKTIDINWENKRARIKTIKKYSINIKVLSNYPIISKERKSFKPRLESFIHSS